MGEVYSSAALIVAWLGESGTDDSMIARVINMAASSDTVIPESFKEDEMVKNSFRNLLRRSWFDRVWVVQEVALAKHAVYLVGRHWCEPFHLCRLWNALFISAKDEDLEFFINGSRILAHNRVQEFVNRELPAFAADLAAMDEFTTTEASKKMSTTPNIEHKPPVTEQVLARQIKPAILSTWAKEAYRLSGSPNGAEELIRAQLYAHLLRRILRSMVLTFRATVEHDYLYGILSMTGGLRYPRLLAPDCKQPPRTKGSYEVRWYLKPFLRFETIRKRLP